MVKIPKYVEKLLEKRRKAAQNLLNASVAVDEYCQKIGIDIDSPLFEEACLYTDVRITCEFNGAINATRDAILKQLQLNEEKKHDNI